MWWVQAIIDSFFRTLPSIRLQAITRDGRKRKTQAPALRSFMRSGGERGRWVQAIIDSRLISYFGEGGALAPPLFLRALLPICSCESAI
jgi:hypothetical protein